MNTFLPSISYGTCARTLDDLRLRKQKIEVNNILDTLSGKSEGWKSHPAVLQWKGYENNLCGYGSFIVKECENRGFKGDTNNTLYNHKIHFAELNGGANICPSWFHDDSIFKSHRSRLLFKGRVDAVCATIKSNKNVFDAKRSINDWLKDRGFPKKNVLTYANVESLESYVRYFNIEIQSNWYAQWGWDENDTLEYIWPVRKKG